MSVKVPALPRIIAPSSNTFIPGFWLGVNVPMEPPAASNPNSTRHWGTKQHYRKKFRKCAREATQAVMDRTLDRPEVPFPEGATLYVHILVGWSKGRMRMDDDNLIASCKGCLDGVADSLGVDDRQFRITGVSQVRDLDGAGWTRITVEAREGSGRNGQAEASNDSGDEVERRDVHRQAK